jgi:hypothetical protein
VSLFRGRIRREGAWREAEVRDYLVREYLDPKELTKRDDLSEGLLPVLKANRLVAFRTGSYDNRLMSSLFFDRRTVALVKTVGSSQEACGASFQRWDRSSPLLRYDTYWEGEGRGERTVVRPSGTVFADEMPFVANAIPTGARVRVLPSMTASNLHAWREGEPTLTVERSGAVTRLRLPSGSLWGEFEYDEEGSLARWRVEGAEEFERVAKRRGYYWEHANAGDEGWVEEDD